MNSGQSLPFTKMHGAGNDFVVLNNLLGQLHLDTDLIKRLADRNFGVGADQVLVVESPECRTHDFKYRIFNADGHEVQQCGNGARCFAQYVFDKGLTQKTQITVETLSGVIQPEIIRPHWVRVNMGQARFAPSSLPFLSDNLETRWVGSTCQYRLPVEDARIHQDLWVSVVSMGNPHVVIVLDRAPDDAFVAHVGALLEHHALFPERVNVGFLTVLDKTKAQLRVFERGVGETLACGTGACAAAVCGMRMGLFADHVEMIKRGGTLNIEWGGNADQDVFLTGSAQTVFEGSFYL